MKGAERIRTRAARAGTPDADKCVELVLRVTVRASDVEHLQTVVDHCAAAREGAHSPPIRNLSDLVTMLCDDLAHVARRPGSWEGANMGAVLSGHGFFNE